MNQEFQGFEVGFNILKQKGKKGKK